MIARHERKITWRTLRACFFSQGCGTVLHFRARMFPKACPKALNLALHSSLTLRARTSVAAAGRRARRGTFWTPSVSCDGEPNLHPSRQPPRDLPLALVAPDGLPSIICILAPSSPSKGRSGGLCYKHNMCSDSPACGLLERGAVQLTDPGRAHATALAARVAVRRAVPRELVHLCTC